MLLRSKHSVKIYNLAVTFNWTNSRYFHCTCPAFIRSLYKRKNEEIRIDVRKRNTSDNIENLPSSACITGPNTNFYGIESDEGVIIVDEHYPSSGLHFEDSPKLVVPEEKLHKTSFGKIRRDVENKVTYHGQFEHNVEPVMYNKNRKYLYKTEETSEEFEPSSFNEITNEKLNCSSDSKSTCDNIYNSASLQSGSTIFTESKNGKQPVFSFTVPASDESNFESLQSGQKHFQNVLENNAEVAIQSSEDVNFIDDFYFHNLQSDQKKFTSTLEKKDQSCEEANFIDDFYFPYTLDQNNEQPENSTIFKEENNLNHLEHDSYFKGNEINPNLWKEGKYLGTHIKSSHEAIQSNCELQKSITNEAVSEKDLKTSEIEKRTAVKNDSHIESGKSRDQNFIDSSKLKIHQKSNSSYTDELKNENTLIEQKATFRDNDNSNLIQQNRKYVKHDLNTNLKSKDLEKKHPIITDDMMSLPQGKAISTSHFNSAGKFMLNISKNMNVKYPEISSMKDEHKFKDTTKLQETAIGNTQKHETAYDFVQKLRCEKNITHHEIEKGKISVSQQQKLDSKGFRILKNQVPDFSHFTRDEIVTILKNSVLYSDDDVLVLNKPYNLVIHESRTTKGACLSTFLEDLAKELDKKNSSPKLFTVHRLDKETTGCLLLARNETMALNLKSLFAQQKILKTYWIVTSKVPDPMEGIIDIPIVEGYVEKKARMVLHPDIPEEVNYKNHSKQGKRAVTNYKVLAVSGNAALVEVKPETGIKHQIRVHFGFGLACPILGDHKYSHLDKLAPQKLPSDLLQRLQVRQSKVRYIPMHIHSRSIVVPQQFDGRNLYVSAPLPEHMKKNLKTLKFSKNV